MGRVVTAERRHPHPTWRASVQFLAWRCGVTAESDPFLLSINKQVQATDQANSNQEQVLYFCESTAPTRQQQQPQQQQQAKTMKKASLV